MKPFFKNISTKYQEAFSVALIGTVAGDGFLPCGHVLEGDLGTKLCWLCTKIRRDRLDFMSIGVFSMYSIGAFP